MWKYVCVGLSTGERGPWFVFAQELIHPTCHFFSSCCHILFCSVHLVSMELICLCLCPPVYSMGRSVGGLERLHHLLLPGRRRAVQGETLEIFRPPFFLFPPAKCSVMHPSARSLSSAPWLIFLSVWGHGCRLARERFQSVISTCPRITPSTLESSF